MLPERKVELYHTELDDFKTELERRNFHKHLTNLVDGSRFGFGEGILCKPTQL